MFQGSDPLQQALAVQYRNNNNWQGLAVYCQAP
jgi:hypothetical protein